MKMMIVGALSVATILSSAACTSDNNQPDTNASTGTARDTAEAHSRPTLTASKIQPPPQDNKYTRSGGRPTVAFDPCTWISDQTVAKLGYDPSSRHRISDIVAEQTFLTCGFSSKLHDLRINSSNVPWANDEQKNFGQSEPVVINGREAMWVHDPEFPGTCEIDLRTKVGFVQVMTDLTDYTNPSETPPCDGLLETAQAVESEIGKDN